MSVKHLRETFSLPSRVLLLGGTGFIGRHLAEMLQKKNVDTRAISSKEIDLTSLNSVHQLKDMTKNDDALVFLSALTPDKGKDVGTMMKNLTMAQNLGTFLESKAVSHLVLVGSDAIYSDDGITTLPVTEDSPCAPSTFYGLAHLGRELIVKGACQKNKVPYLALRPSAVYGKGDSHNSYGPNRFLKTALSDKKIVLFGEGEEKRDHISVQDVCALITLALGHLSVGVLNATTGHSISFMDVAKKIQGQTDSGVKIECLPRSSTITHRHFDVTNRIRAFPQFSPTLL